MDLADPHFYKAAGIDVVLGADLYLSIITEGLDSPWKRHTSGPSYRVLLGIMRGLH